MWLPIQKAMSVGLCLIKSNAKVTPLSVQQQTTKLIQPLTTSSTTTTTAVQSAIVKSPVNQHSQQAKKNKPTIIQQHKDTTKQAIMKRTGKLL